MLQDLGIHMDGERSDDRDNLSQEELESRRHSFWSAYLWDKMISLYMGRTPMLQLSTYSPPEPACQPFSQHHELIIETDGYSRRSIRARALVSQRKSSRGVSYFHASPSSCSFHLHALL